MEALAQLPKRNTQMRNAALRITGLLANDRVKFYGQFITSCDLFLWKTYYAMVLHFLTAKFLSYWLYAGQLSFPFRQSQLKND